MKIYNIKKEGRLINHEIKAGSKEQAIESYLLFIGFNYSDFKDQMFMDCWEAVESLRNLQVLLQNEIISKTSINIVTCGNCANTILHRLKEVEEMVCPYCNYKGEVSDFPDLNG